MKLRKIYNEVKLIPSNRILLKKYNNDYYFEINNKTYTVYDFEIEDGTITFVHNLSNIKHFLDSKKIKYGTDNVQIYIDAKYFIVPD